MITCIAIDDEPLALEIIQQFCSRISFLQMDKTFTSTKAAADYLKENKVDLLFLDIQMPDINGVDFFKSMANAPLLILTTAHAQYALEGFNINAVDFLLKPVHFKRFEEAVLKAKGVLETVRSGMNDESRSLFVRADYALVKIPFVEILYIETLDDYIKIHLIGKKPVLTISSIKKILEKLPAGEFLRVHRSFVVPVARIESVRGKMISLGIAEIPIGKNYEKEFFITYMRNSF